MKGRALIELALIVAVGVALVFGGCGNSSSSGDSTSDVSEIEASKTFLSSKGKNKIATFGEEASAEERESASEVLEENMKARAAGEWAKQCSSLTQNSMFRVRGTVSAGANVTCAAGLKRLGEPVSETKAGRANTMTGPIDALRVKENRGFALYHGTEGKDYMMRMARENGEWKVDAVVPIRIP